MKRLLFTFAALAFCWFCRARSPDTNLLDLADGWKIQSADSLARGQQTDGAAISSEDFSVRNWHRATVPSTVLAALVKDGIYKDIFFGTNLAKIPRAPFTSPWWFRNEFDVHRDQAAANADLIFEGINYRANVWLN